jgi:hypothetical protein
VYENILKSLEETDFMTVAVFIVMGNDHEKLQKIC